MNKTRFTENPEGKMLTVERVFRAPVEKVWAAWTEQGLLEQWWAPKPWKAVTKSFEFKEGGRWHYYMAGPKGEQHWCLADYLKIEPQRRFTARDGFCDERAKLNTDLPGTHWENTFQKDGDKTRVTVAMTFAAPEDMKKIIKMGFKEGFSTGLDQLESLLAKS